MFKRAEKTLVNGVSSTYQVRDPYPIYFTHGKGSKIYSVDGQEISDFHNGFGCMVQGHAHPAIVETIKKRCELGTQFALPTEDSVIVAEHLAHELPLPKWSFVNSGSEATMDAIRIARAYTGRDVIMKIFGSYHGHHDYVMVGHRCRRFREHRAPRQLQVVLLRRRHPAGRHRHDRGRAVQRRRAWMEAASSTSSPRAASRPASSWKPP